MNQQQYCPGVLVTRPQHQAINLVNLLKQQGWNAVEFPTIEIIALRNADIQRKLFSLSQYDWIIFISVNAVNFALAAIDGKIEHFNKVSIAAVGKSTAKALNQAGLQVSLLPRTEFSSNGLLATAEMNDVAGKSCLIIRGQGGLETLAETLRARAAIVDYLDVYARQKPENKKLDAVKLDSINVLTVTSGEALKNLLAMTSLELHDKVFSIPLVVISNRIKIIAKNCGFKHIVVTDSPSDAAIIESVSESLSN